ncbi:MAG: outer membrane beta-barrel protein [Pseudomonadales bacterium]|nr:outer membrane beta-barrel protein [Pseudomonadales bacterium]
MPRLQARSRNFFTCLTLCSTSLLLASPQSHAQMYRLAEDRAGKWETSLMWKYQDAADISHKNGNRVEFSSADRWGFTLGYNPSNHFNVHWAFSYLKPGYTANIAQENLPPLKPGEDPYPHPATIDHTASVVSNQLNFAYNILKGKFTPYISAGLGWTNIDSNIVSGGGIICSPYYPYWCSTYTNTFNDTNFSYNVGAGIRWDIDRDTFIRAGISQEYVDMSGISGSTPTFNTGQFEFGFRL